MDSLTKLKKLIKRGPILQIALDLLELDKAISIARKAYSEEPGVIIEVGTPLIKYAGVEAIKKIRQELPDALILADMKTADVGALEVSIAAEAGADIVTVLGAVGDEVVEEAVWKAHELGVAVQVDMIGVRDVVKRGSEVAKLDVDIVGLHVGIDVQRRRGITAAVLTRAISELRILNLLVSVAGGLRPETIPEVVHSGAHIVVVGGYITHSDNPREAVRRCLEALTKSF